MMSIFEEDFELELRALPGVLNVGISHGEDGEVDAVTLLVRDHEPESVRALALQVTSLYYPEARVEVSGVPEGSRIDGARVALVQADFDQRDGMSEVHLRYDGRVGVGRSGSGPLIGGAEAALGAMRDLKFSIPFYLMSVAKVDITTGWSVIVTLRSATDGGERLGIARLEGELVSAAKATLAALNRYVTMDPGITRDEAPAAATAPAPVAGDPVAGDPVAPAVNGNGNGVALPQGDPMAPPPYRQS